jgi:hypothetical protein
MGAGMAFTYALGIPVPTFLELEAGFAGCSYGIAGHGDEFNEVFNEWFNDAVEDTLGLGGGAAASALGDVHRMAGESSLARTPGRTAAMLSRLNELRTLPGGGGLDLDYRVGKVLGRIPTEEEMTAVAQRLRDEKAELGDSAAAEEEALRLQQQLQLHDPAAAAAAAAALGQAEYNGPRCTADDPYGRACHIIPATSSTHTCSLVARGNWQPMTWRAMVARPHAPAPPR